LRNRLQERQRSRECDNIGDVLDFAALDFAIFRVVIAVGQQFDDCGEARPAVGFAHDFVRNQAMFEGPAGPHAGDRGRGINEHPVHIEEHGTAMNQSHRQSCIPSVKNVSTKGF
jgi:hypothetical protein